MTPRTGVDLIDHWKPSFASVLIRRLRGVVAGSGESADTGCTNRLDPAAEAKEHHLEQALLDDIQKSRLELGATRRLSHL